MGCGMDNFPYVKAQEFLVSHNATAKSFFEGKKIAAQLDDKSSSTSTVKSKKNKKTKKKVRVEDEKSEN
jgi:hypothetical protein